MTRLTRLGMVTVCGLSLSVLAASAQAQTITQVMSGLDSPRGLAFGPEGGLYVAEAGVPGSSGFCVTVAVGTNCYSETGKVTRLYRGAQERVAEGLPSIFNTVRMDVNGANDISFHGRGNGFVTIGWTGEPAARAGLGAKGSLVGTLISLQPSGRWRVDADIAALEDANNPAGGPKDSNPFGVLALSGEQYVADAGGNSLLRVAANGTVSVVTTFAPVTIVPPPATGSLTAEPVPTSVNVGPDGALYVSLLTGVPFANGIAKIYRVVPGQPNAVYQDGFRTIIDFAFGPDGSLYVLEHSATGPGFGAPGRITKITRDTVRHVINTGARLQRPTAIIVDEDGAIYVSNKGAGVPAGAGEVLKIVE